MTVASVRDPLPDIGAAAIGVRPLGDQCEYNYRTDTLTVQTLNLEKLASIAAHELNHLLMHISTPYGQFLDTLVEAEIGLTTGYCASHLNEHTGTKILHPVYKIARRHITDPAPFVSDFPHLHFVPDYWQRFVRPWSNMVYAERLFEGSVADPCPTIDAAVRVLESVETTLFDPPPLFSAGWGLRLRGAARGAPPSDHASLVHSDTTADPCCPGITLHGDHVFIGAFQILECLATLQEGDTLRESLHDNATWPTHWAAYFFGVAKLMRAGIDLAHFDSQAGFDELVFTLQSAAHLALYTPVGQPYALLRQDRKLAWQDLHPGYRFSLALGVIDKLGLVRDRGGIAGHQDAICEQLGWPAPDSFLALARKCAGETFVQRRHAQCMDALSSDRLAYLFNEVVPEFLAERGPLMSIAGRQEGVLLRPRGGEAAYFAHHVLSRLTLDVMRNRVRPVAHYLPVVSGMDASTADVMASALSVFARDNFLEHTLA